jgi:hypothetical protein
MSDERDETKPPKTHDRLSRQVDDPEQEPQLDAERQSAQDKPMAVAPAAEKRKRPRGFAAMDPALVSTIPSKGGKAAHSAGTAHQLTREERARRVERAVAQRTRSDAGVPETFDGDLIQVPRTLTSRRSIFGA